MTATDERVVARRGAFAGTRAANRSRRVLLWIIVVVLGYAVVHGFLSGATAPDNQSQRRSSSFDTGDDGTRAYADLLTHYGYAVLRQTGSLAHAPLPAGGTVVLFDAPSLAVDEAAHLMEFVSDGGRLVVGGTDPPFLGRFVHDPPEWGPVHQATWTVDNRGEFGAVHTVNTASEGAWISPGASAVRVGNTDASLITELRVGRGTIVFVADTTPFNNFLIGSADNAAFAVAVAAPASQPVVFAEGVHGYEGATGWAALPARWRLALVVLVAVAGLFAWSRGVRLGPPEAEERELAPARAQYLDAIGTTLQRGGDREAARAALAANARSLLARRGIDVTGRDAGAATRAELEHLGAVVGAEPRELASLFTEGAPIDDDALVGAGRAFTAIERSVAPRRRAPTSLGVE